MVEMEDIPIDSDDTDNEKDSKEEKKRHKKLLKEIDSISGVKQKRKKKSTRNEPSKDVSEFNWTSNSGDSSKLQLHELISTLDAQKKPIAKAKKNLRKMEKTVQKLEKPLTKPEAQKVERVVAFSETSEQVKKWQPTVIKNREAEQLSFPLNEFRPPAVSTKTLVNIKPENDLEREINAVLKGSAHLLERKGAELTQAEEQALKEFDLQEALERRKELQKNRALQSYYESKCRRSKKIKSKKYHRILKKEEQKKLSKIDVDALAKDDPELFKSELEKAEKMRATERANLRHRNTSKWAKNLITKGRKTKEDQERIREQLRVSRELTNNKTVAEDKSEDEEENCEEEITLLKNDQAGNNPWLMGSKDEESEEMTDSKGISKLTELKSNEVDNSGDEEEDTRSSGDEWDAEEEENKEKTTKKENKKSKKKEKIKKATDNEDIDMTITKSKKSVVEADALRLLRSDEDVVELQSAGDSSDDEDMSYDNEAQRMNIREAFANDDVIGDFVDEKQEIVDKAKPKPVDNVLPGWGDWGGAGLVVLERKRKRFTKEAGPAPKRKDEKLANVVISETRNSKLAKLQVGEVPFPYSSKAEFERSLRQPTGTQWNTPSVFNKLIEPRISTKAGAVIDPIKPSRKLKKKLKTT